MSNKDKVVEGAMKVLPVDTSKYSSRTYYRTGQPYTGLGQWLLYQERKLKGKSYERYNRFNTSC